MSGLSKLEFCEKTLELVEQGNYLFLEVGKRLKRIREERLYAPQWESFGEFEEEFHWKEGTASKLITVYSRFVLEYSIPNERLAKVGGWSTLYEIHTIAKTKEEAEKWIDRRIGGLDKHFRQELRAEKKGINLENHAHTFIDFRMCTECKVTERIYEEEKLPVIK